jgi:hypothetical protein
MFPYDPYEIKLANEIADTLNDKDALQLYLQFTRKYKEAFLRKVLARVMSIPENKIRRSRGALFTFLITKQGNNDNSGD